MPDCTDRGASLADGACPAQKAQHHTSGSPDARAGATFGGCVLQSILLRQRRAAFVVLADQPKLKALRHRSSSNA